MSEAVMKRCPSYYGYLASDDGGIWSARVMRVKGGGVNFESLRKLKPQKCGRGYQVVYIATPANGIRPVKVHTLVADAFIGPKPAWATLVRHLDDNRQNNVPSNIAYGTHVDNAADMKRNGNRIEGVDHPNSKLSIDSVLEIRSICEREKRTKKLYLRLALDYGVCTATIQNIVHRRRYANLNHDLPSLNTGDGENVSGESEVRAS